MTEIRFTRDLFLRCVNLVYLFAFSSLYVQIPGLYGKNGVLPAHTELDLKENDFAAKLQKKPTLLWFAPYLGLNTELMMDVLCIFGMFLAFTGFISRKFCTKPGFAALWSLYYSLYQVGQTFMWFQWDILLLETGFLCILFAPFRAHKLPHKSKKAPQTTSQSEISFWLIKWLLFRLLFSSPILKLSSGCPSWWGLTALKVHFESMCLPTPLAWYSHHLPVWFLKLNTVFALFAESAIPILFFAPVRSLRLIAFFIEVFLQITIILTGNFNFFNYLTLALCLSLVDDEFFGKTTRRVGTWVKVGSWIFGLVVVVGLFAGMFILGGLQFLPNGVIESKLMFTKPQFDEVLGAVFPFVIAGGALSLAVTCFKALQGSLSGSCLNSFLSLLSTLFYIVVAVFIFADSLVPFSSLHPSSNVTLFAPIREIHNKISHLHLTNAYGLYRKMTGVNGRPEVIIEGANDLKGPWLEYNFLYKPGNVNQSLPFVAPHQPRLDWQMWFAALGTYHQNPWIMSLTYRILTGQPEVLNLMGKNPFPSNPPKYIRASLYHYHYTPWTQRFSTATWTRERIGEYFPVFSKDHAPLLDYLKDLKILSKDKREEKLDNIIVIGLLTMRATAAAVNPTLFILSVVMSGVAIMFFSKILFSSTPKPQPNPPTNKQNQRQRKFK